MKRILIAVILLVCCALSQAQQAVSTNNSLIPALVNFSGVLTDVNGKPLTGVVGVTFYLYQEQQGGSPLWIENKRKSGGESGIRTHVRVSPKHAFQACAFSHSAISPIAYLVSSTRYRVAANYSFLPRPFVRRGSFRYPCR
jgi:hypothetical protein